MFNFLRQHFDGAGKEQPLGFFHNALLKNFGGIAGEHVHGLLQKDRAFIHTYKCDGNPIPSFEGEPERVDVVGDIDEFTDLVWNNLNEDNKVSLFVRYINIQDGSFQTRIVNKNK